MATTVKQNSDSKFDNEISESNERTSETSETQNHDLEESEDELRSSSFKNFCHMIVLLVNIFQK